MKAAFCLAVSPYFMEEPIEDTKVLAEMRKCDLPKEPTRRQYFLLVCILFVLLLYVVTAVYIHGVGCAGSALVFHRHVSLRWYRTFQSSSYSPCFVFGGRLSQVQIAALSPVILPKGLSGCVLFFLSSLQHISRQNLEMRDDPSPPILPNSLFTNQVTGVVK